jgi:hypothetical protein
MGHAHLETEAKSGHRPATYPDPKAVAPHLMAEILFGILQTRPALCDAPLHVVASNSLGHEISGPFQKERGVPRGGYL